MSFPGSGRRPRKIRRNIILRREKANRMKRKYASVLLTVILCLFFSACGNSERSDAGSTENVLQSADGKYELTVPMGWEDVTKESDGNVLLSIQKNSVDYMAMTAEETSLELEDYTVKVAEELKRNMVTDGKVTVGQPDVFPVGENRGCRIVLFNKVDDAVICSNIYCIEMEGRYIQINCVYIKSIQPEMSREYDEMVRTLRPAG